LRTPARRIGRLQLDLRWHYRVHGNVLVVDQLGTTDMACNPPALMAQETWLHQLLSSQPTLALDGDT
jgi:heat shock protein HslJ